MLGEEAQPVPRDVVAVMEPPNAEAAARWSVNFWVADANRAAAITERRGGNVLIAPAAAGPFRSATLRDPEGGVFTVSQLLQGA